MNSNLRKVVKVGCCTEVMILWIAVPIRQEMSVPLEINQYTTEIYTKMKASGEDTEHFHALLEEGN